MAETIGGANLEIGASTEGFTRELGKAGEAAKQFDRTIDKTATNVAQSQGRMASQSEKSARTIKLQQDRMVAYINRIGRQSGKSRSEYLSEEVSRLGIDPARVKESLGLLKQQEEGLKKVGMSSKQTAQAMRLLPAQITDIVVSLASGQPAYMVALQQGGQLKDMFGGVGAAARALAAGLKSALIATLNPLVLSIVAVVTAVTTLYQIFRQAGTETSALANALVATGNYAGTTTSQLIDMAANISSVIGTQRQASAALTALAATGTIASRQFETLGKATVAWSKATGTSVEDIVKNFVALGKEPAEASLKLNESMNYLTGSVYAQIRALEDQGRMLEAGELAQNEYSRAMATRAKTTTENLGTIEKAWRGIAEWAKKGWDAMLGVGREKSATEKLAETRNALEFLTTQRDQAVSMGGSTEAIDAQIVAHEQLIDQMERAAKASADAAVQEGKQAEQNKQDVKNIQFKEYWAGKYGSTAAKAQIEINRLQKEYNRELTKAEKAQVLADMTKKGPKEKEVRDSAATKMLQDLREAERVLDREIEQRQELNVHAEKLVEFEQTISNIAAKRQKDRTAEDKSLFAYQDAIRGQLRVNSAKEKERDLVETIEKSEQRQNERNIDAANKLLALRQQLLSTQETREEGYQAQLGTAMSDRAEEELKEQMSLAREYDKMLEKLRRDTPVSELGTQEYLRQLEEINAAMEVAIRRQEQFNQARGEQRSSATFGTNKAFENYIDDATNKAEQFQGAWENAFSGIEDTFIDFATTGKLSFKNLADSMVADLTRIMMKALMMKAITGMMGSYDTGGLDSLIGQQSSQYGSFTGSGFGSQNDFMPQAAGTNYVPYDGFKASLHRGEAVVPARYNPAAGGTSPKQAAQQQPIVQYITVQGGGGGQSAPERDQMRRMFRDGVRSGLSEARGRNSPLL